METTLQAKPAKFQGMDEIIINAPIERVWRLIADSKMLEKWGPPVREVSVTNVPEKLLLSGFSLTAIPCCSKSHMLVKWISRAGRSKDFFL